MGLNRERAFYISDRHGIHARIQGFCLLLLLNVEAKDWAFCKMIKKCQRNELLDWKDCPFVRVVLCITYSNTTFSFWLFTIWDRGIGVRMCLKYSELDNSFCAQNKCCNFAASPLNSSFALQNSS